MISNENLGSIMGAPVIGPDDDRIGTVGQVFVDPTTGSPNWVTVHTGLFGRRETFVPLNDADWDREVLRIPYEKGLVKDAPRIGTDEALDPRAEDELYRYYGIALADSGEASDHDTGDGNARLRKYVVTEQQESTAPFTHEEARLETDPAGAEPAESAAGPDSTNPSERKQRGRHRA